VEAWSLSGADIHAHNNIAQPEAVKPKILETRLDGNALRDTLPPASVVKIQAQLT